MDKTIKADWLTALRSGEYEQGTGYLKKGNQYCCLGVLCDLAVKAGVIEAPELDGDIDRVYLYDGNLGSLPNPVMKWSGVSEGGMLPEGVEVRGQSQLWKLNDSEGMTFQEIADVIEKHF